jgi:hypothetical protein
MPGREFFINEDMHVIYIASWGKGLSAVLENDCQKMPLSRLPKNDIRI